MKAMKPLGFSRVYRDVVSTGPDDTTPFTNETTTVRLLVSGTNKQGREDGLFLTMSRSDAAQVVKDLIKSMRRSDAAQLAMEIITMLRQRENYGTTGTVEYWAKVNAIQSACHAVNLTPVVDAVAEFEKTQF